jgi:hypothetical protein
VLKGYGGAVDAFAAIGGEKLLAATRIIEGAEFRRGGLFTPRLTCWGTVTKDALLRRNSKYLFASLPMSSFGRRTLLLLTLLMLVSPPLLLSPELAEEAVAVVKEGKRFPLFDDDS